MSLARRFWILLLVGCVLFPCAAPGTSLAQVAASQPTSPPATRPAATSPSAAYPTQPEQPASGFGGSDYPHRDMVDWSLGAGGTQVWVFEPASPAPDSAPVVVMMHGWIENNPRAYGAWIRHMVRRGNIVIYPRYQAFALSPISNYVDDAATGIKSALDELLKPGHVRPMLNQCTMVGHSCGASIIVALAASASDRKIPAPKAIVVVEPGASRALAMGDVSKVPANTLIAMIVGDRDRVVGSVEAVGLYKRMEQVPREKRVFITLRTDAHGSPTMAATHEAPLALAPQIDGMDIPDRITGKSANQAGPMDLQPRANAFLATPPDAMDFYGLWKTTDAVFDAAIHGADLPDSVIHSKEFRSMGVWSDGVPATPLDVRREP